MADTPVRKAVLVAVLVGGECDGLVVRVASVPPDELVVLVEANVEAPGRAFVMTGPSFPQAVATRAVRYTLRPMVGFPAATRIVTYVPQEHTNV